MQHPSRNLAALFLSASLLASCGGGGGGVDLVSSGGNGGGIGGTGVTSSGTIDGFGSIFVNGVEFETGDAKIVVDGEVASEQDLGLGMVAVVDGTINDDGASGSASQVVVDNELQGPITAITPAADGDTKLLDILGIGVIVERTGTVYEGVSFASLAVGDVVEVSGFLNEDFQLRATRVEKKDDFVSGSTVIERKGVVTGLSGTMFTLGDFIVDFSNADLSGLPGGVVTEGMAVEVHGTLTDQLIEADRIQPQDDLAHFLAEGEEAEVTGAITDYAGAGDFRVDGVPVDASGAEFSPQDLALGNGVVVQVEGTWNGSTLIASEVVARRGRVKIGAVVASVDTAAGTVTLQLFPGTVSVRVDAGTLLDDETDVVDDLALGDLSGGDFLEVEAIGTGNDLLATRIVRAERGDDVLQAPVEAFTPGVDITLLGVTYGTAGASFKSEDNGDIGSEAFFAQLQVGDLVKVKDEPVADGIADEVDFEYADELDGDREFDSDCAGDGTGDGESDGVCGSGEAEDDSNAQPGSGEDAGDEPDQPDQADEPDQPDQVNEPDQPDQPDAPDQPEAVTP